jgi:HAD superfamily hydrolase (TIGR01509 family)
MKNFIMFDFDGTLVDTQTIYDEIIIKTLFKISSKYTPEYCLEIFNGNGWKEMFDEIAELEPHYDVKGAYLEAISEAIRLTIDGVKTTPNVKEVLVRLKKDGCKVAICSNSSLHVIKKQIHLCNLSEFFNEDWIFTPEESKGEKGKPSPDVYLKAIKHLKVNEGECLVIEDSLAGLLSASSAKIDTLFYKGGVHHKGGNSKTNNIRRSIQKAKHNTIVGEIDDLTEIFNFLQ